MNVKALFISVLLILMSCITLSAQAYSLYRDPLHIQPYIGDPTELIKAGMAQYQWQVESEEAGKIVAVLDYKQHILKVNVYYSAEKIWLEPLSAVNNGRCKKSPCKVDSDAVERWHLGLYRGIAHAFTKAALRDASEKAYQ
jgi:hypothetical protein